MADRPAVDPRRTNLAAVPHTFELDDGFLPDYAEPGRFELRTYGTGERYLVLACPGCGKVAGMAVGDPKPSASPSWLITGPPAAPTLHPSVNCVGCCGWHGWLKNGVFAL